MAPQPAPAHLLRAPLNPACVGLVPRLRARKPFTGLGSACGCAEKTTEALRGGGTCSRGLRQSPQEEEPQVSCLSPRLGKGPCHSLSVPLAAQWDGAGKAEVPPALRVLLTGLASWHCFHFLSPHPTLPEPTALTSPSPHHPYMVFSPLQKRQQSPGDSHCLVVCLLLGEEHSLPRLKGLVWFFFIIFLWLKIYIMYSLPFSPF